MAVKGYYDFDVKVVGRDERNEEVAELRKVRFDMITLIRSCVDPHKRSAFAEEGALRLVAKAHPSWKNLSVEACVEV